MDIVDTPRASVVDVVDMLGGTTLVVGAAGSLGGSVSIPGGRGASALVIILCVSKLRS